jgi:hypothetical protein
MLIGRLEEMAQNQEAECRGKDNTKKRMYETAV